uniref:Uncharacterized protein n=1 Tax=Myoviridae sp. ctqfO1 TaxID=2827710 RepID=A0A8S5T2F8_9CAUD|nr:MAG TPA: hypothetical protein [Myoviridae sp. ctqfO1]
MFSRQNGIRVYLPSLTDGVRRKSYEVLVHFNCLLSA